MVSCMALAVQIAVSQTMSRNGLGLLPTQSGWSYPLLGESESWDLQAQATLQHLVTGPETVPWFISFISIASGKKNILCPDGGYVSPNVCLSPLCQCSVNPTLVMWITLELILHQNTFLMWCLEATHGVPLLFGAETTDMWTSKVLGRFLPEKASQMMSWEQGSCTNTIFHPQEIQRGLQIHKHITKASVDLNSHRRDTRAGI